MSRGRSALLLLILLVVLGLAGGAWWLVIRPKIQVAPTAQAPRAFRGEPEKVAERIDELANPFLSAPCFVSSENTCQLVFVHPSEYGQERIEIRPYVLPGRQSAATNFFLQGRMLVAQGELARFYSTSLTKGGDNQPYLEFVRQLPDAGQQTGLNPAFIYSLYERHFAIAQNLNEIIGSDLALPELSPYHLGEAYQEGLRLLSSPVGDPLIDALNATTWSKEAKATAYALAKTIPPDQVVAMLGEEGAIENVYQRLFGPANASQISALRLGTGTLSLPKLFEGLSAPPDPEGDYPYLTAVCRLGSGYACRAEAETLVCSPVREFSPDCLSSLINL